MLKKIYKVLGIALTVSLLASLLSVAAPAAALTQPTVALSAGALGGVANQIGNKNVYTITFTAGVAVPAGGNVTISFPASGPDPSGMEQSALHVKQANDVMIEAVAGISGGPISAGPGPVNATSYNVTGSPALGYNVILTVPAAGIGAGSLVGITLGTATGIVNPNTPADYTLTVATSTALGVPIEAAVTSAIYTINAPSILPLPGIVLAYNSAGVLMSQGTSIQGGINIAGVGGRVEVGSGTFDEAVIINLATQLSQTIIATGDPGTVIMQDANSAGGGGTFTVSVAAPASNIGVTIDGFTFKKAPAPPVSAADMITLNAGASYVTIKNCDIYAGTTSAINIAAAAGTNNKIMNCTIDATGATGAKTGIIAANQVAVSDTTITVGSSPNSQAVVSSAGVPLLPTTMTNVTVTGTSGKGVAVTGGNATITDSTLSNLNTAITVNGGGLTVKGTTIDGCGSSTIGSGIDAIEVLGALSYFNMYNSTLTNSAANNYALGVAAGTVIVNFNDITGNAKNLNVAVPVVADHNWWGASTGPAAGSNFGAGLATSVLTPYLGNAVTNANVAMGVTSLVSKSTVGIDVAAVTATGAPTAMDVVGVSKYDANPEITAPPIVGTGSVLGYYDVYVKDATPPASIQLKFYGTVDTYTKLYYAGSLAGQWATPSTWGVNAAGGYVYCTITATSNPSFNDLAGLPFALVEDKTTAPPVINTPAIGAVDVAIAPVFTWNAVIGAVRYEVTIADEPSFAIPIISNNTDINFFSVSSDEALDYDTTYYWRVRAVLEDSFTAGTAATAYQVGIFTTEMAPVAPADDQPNIVVEPTKPEITVEIPPTKITVQPAEAAAIPTYILWIIVVVGAVLIIALIVLIVRTRRA